jgi:DNA-binding transcriptional regulator YhcF (GntR family)
MSFGNRMVQTKREGGLTMEFKNSKGIFLQIADSISEKVMEGQYPPGEKIPSVRDLATEMGVNPNTVMRTYTDLQTRGIIDNKRGIGYYVSNEALAIIHKWKREEFFEFDLPLIVKQTKILGITYGELKPYFESNNKSDIHENK